ncbi:AP-5 complex subunit sigma-1-like [Saccoglossus kowalevskii]|uniref:AP-5 complex subunit sigma-1-like n=1 Tax=Saccoglossus kowalevskii TaxID=10224 RepID=A0ABM0GPD2_SACKO|nr:PREDICTED: AP-5 complex subunit sigma-1-like [Saccoglossus kowalevskii]
MVYAFLIHTVQPGTCRVIYSTTFGQEAIELDRVETIISTGSTDTQGLAVSQARSSPIGHELRTVRKEQLQIVAKQVQSEFSFRRAVSGRSYEDEMQILGSDETALPFEKGVLRLRAGDPFVEERIVVWEASVNCAFALVCSRHENRIQAETVLTTVIRYLQEYVRVISQPTEAMTKADKVTTILHQFLPNGQILFMNHRLLKQLEKGMELLMSGK